MMEDVFLERICLLKVHGEEVYVAFNTDTNTNEYRATYFVIVYKLNQTYKEGKYIYGHVTITEPEWQGGLKNFSQLEKRIQTIQKEMYKVFLKEFPNQNEKFIFVKGEEGWRD